MPSSNLLNCNLLSSQQNQPVIEEKVSQQNGIQQDNIQLAIDNLKHFIKGNFPVNPIQSTRMMINQKIMNQKQIIGRPPLSYNSQQIGDCTKSRYLQRELSEDPRQQLLTAFLNNQKNLNNNLEESNDDIDCSKDQRRNPHEPIPAFTSIDIAKKMRYRSEDRYINDKMEKELVSYQKEIEKRFQKSQMMDYKFPKVQTEPLSKELISQLIQGQNSSCSLQSNKENINQQVDRPVALSQMKMNCSPKSPYGYCQANSYSAKNTNGYRIQDYKQTLSQFLSNSNKKSQSDKLSINHNREQSCNIKKGESMISQKLFSNAKQKIIENQKREIRANNKYIMSTFIDKFIVKEESEDLEFDLSKDYKGQYTEADEFMPIQVEEISGLDSSSQNMKTFDYSYKASHANLKKNLQSFTTKGFQTSANQISQKLRRDLASDGVLKRHAKKQNNNKAYLTKEKTLDNRSMNKSSIRTTEYFKTFYHKSSKQSITEKARNTVNAMTSDDKQNPFTTISSVNCNHNQNSSSKKHKSNKSITSKLQNNPQQTNQFQMKINLQHLINDNQKISTRNNKLTSGNGMHVRAKTTSDFEQLSSNSKLKILQAALSQQQQTLEIQKDNQSKQVVSSSTTNNSQKQSFASKEKDQSKMKNNNKKEVSQDKKLLASTSTHGRNDDLKKIQSLKLQKSGIATYIEQKQAMICNGFCSDKHNPYSRTTQSQNQLLYSQREIQRREKRGDSCNNNNMMSNNGTNSVTRISCPYTDTNKLGLQSVCEANSKSLKHIFSSFSNQVQTNSAQCSSRKKKQELNMIRSNSKRDFKVKCMKIDLTKQVDIEK